MVVTVAPMAKKDAAPERLAKVIAAAKLIKKVTLPDGPEELPESLRLNEKGPWNRPILDAFRACDLDHRNIEDWNTLVFLLARALFPERRPPGRLQKWTDERLCQLLADVAACKRRRPRASDASICRWLQKRYLDVSEERLRRVLQDARNPAHNGELAQMADVLAGRLKAQGKAWTEAYDEAVRRIIADADKVWPT
jgi:hypothetical protein